MKILEDKIRLPARADASSCLLYTKLYVKKALGDQNVVILLPGGPGNDMSMYDTDEMSIAQTFNQVTDVILFDPRACGKSEPCDVMYCSMDHYIDDVEAIRKYYNIKPEQFFVFGQSYGAIAAIGYACRYPNSLSKLLLIGGVVNSSFYDEAKQRLAEIGTDEQIKFAEKLWNGSFDGTLDEVADFYRIMSPLYSYTFVPGEPPLEIGYNVDVMNYGWGTFLQHFDHTDQLHNIHCDTLILWGEDEWIMPKSHIDQLQLSIPNSRLKTYPECMHMLWIDQWQRFVSDSLTFLGDTKA